MDGSLPTRRRSEKALNPPVGTVPLAQRGTQVAYYGLAGTLSHPGVEVVAYEVAFLGGTPPVPPTPREGGAAPEGSGSCGGLQICRGGSGWSWGGVLEEKKLYRFIFFYSWDLLILLAFPACPCC